MEVALTLENSQKTSPKVKTSEDLWFKLHHWAEILREVPSNKPGPGPAGFHAAEPASLQKGCAKQWNEGKNQMCLALTWIGREGKEVSLGHVSLRSHRNGCWRKKYFVYLALHSIFMKCVTMITSRLACVQKLAYSLKWYSYAFLVWNARCALPGCKQCIR